MLCNRETKVRTQWLMRLLAGVAVAAVALGFTMLTAGVEAGEIITSGVAELTTVPDQATVIIGTQHTADTAVEAQAEVASRMQAVQAALKKAGIPENDIKTITFRVGPQYDWVDGQRVFRGYTVTHQLSVKLSDIELLGPLFDSVVVVGATNIDDVRFSTSKMSELQREALKLAVEDARERAAAMAAGAGLNELHIVRIQDNSARDSSIQPVLTYTATLARAESAATSVAPGQVTVRAVVTVHFEY